MPENGNALINMLPAIDRIVGACDKTRFFGSEERYKMGYFFRAA